MGRHPASSSSDPTGTLDHFFDGSLMKTGAGAGLLFISPLGKHLRYVMRLHFPASNNVAEYEALVNGCASPSS
jgi:ribonuclease HI